MTGAVRRKLYSRQPPLRGKVQHLSVLGLDLLPAAGHEDVEVLGRDGVQLLPGSGPLALSDGALRAAAKGIAPEQVRSVGGALPLSIGTRSRPSRRVSGETAVAVAAKIVAVMSMVMPT